jgi:hypothetical protein
LQEPVDILCITHDDSTAAIAKTPAAIAHRAKRRLVSPRAWLVSIRKRNPMITHSREIACKTQR